MSTATVFLMRESYYGFKKTPFSRDIPTDKLYRGNDSDELIERLRYAAERQLFAVMTGDSGTGKTTILRRFHDEMPNSRFTIMSHSKTPSMLISDSKMTPRSFYKSMLDQLGAKSSYSRSDAKRQLHKEIEIMKGVNGMIPVIIVDESHLLDREMLEEVRFLLNFKMDSQSPMALILAGQTELWDKLRLQAYAAIWQRVDINCAIGRLDKLQTFEYVKAHMEYACCDREIFSEAAVDDIFAYSGGTPRLINKACTCALMYGAQNRKNIIDDRMVTLVIEREL